MSGTTSRYRLPYPTAGDPVYLGASQMESLARACETAIYGVAQATATGVVNATANTLVLRDSGGRVKAANPVSGTDAVNIQWLNSQSFATTSNVATAKSEAVTAAQTWVGQQNYATRQYVDEKIAAIPPSEGGGGGGGPVSWTSITGKPNVVVGTGINEIRAVATAPAPGAQVPGVLYVVTS